MTMPFGSIIGMFESISEDFEVFGSLCNDGDMYLV